MPEAIDAAGPLDAIAPEGSTRATPRLPRMLASVVVLLGVFWVVEHDPIFANARQSEAEEDEVRDKFIEQMQRGNAPRQAGLVGFGLFGAVALATRSSRAWNPRWSVLTPLLAILMLCLLSAAWSGQPLLTAKRLVVLGCVVFGCAGLARLLTPREFLTVSLVTLASFIALALLIDLAAGGRPWAGGTYRFGGTLHPNAQANYCGLMCLAAAVHPIGFGKRWVLRLVLLTGLALILATQSRTGLISTAVAMAAAWTMRLESGMRWAGALGIVAAGAAAFVAYNAASDGDRQAVIDAALLGRNEQSGSLTGRLPLWEELLKDAAERPILGYGYEGFWTEDRIAGILKTQNWTLQNAHNSYFEVLLQLGFVGLFFAVWFLVSGAGVLIGANVLTRDPGYAFAFGVLAYGVANSTLESLFVRIRFCPTLALAGLLMAALYFPTGGDDSDEGDERAPSADATPTRGAAA